MFSISLVNVKLVFQFRCCLCVVYFVNVLESKIVNLQQCLPNCVTFNSCNKFNFKRRLIRECISSRLPNLSGVDSFAGTMRIL